MNSFAQDNEVHLYSGLLSFRREELEQLETLLAPDEKARAERFKFAVHKARFIAARGLLRRTLAAYFGSTPESIQFEYSAFGKPAIPASSVHFNVAHSEDGLLIAVAANPVGADLEVRRAIPELDLLTHQVFSEVELQKWRGRPDRSTETFLSLWTRKEALLKGIGLGIANHVKDVSVFFSNSDPLIIPTTLNTGSWTVETLHLASEIWSVALMSESMRIVPRSLYNAGAQREDRY